MVQRHRSDHRNRWRLEHIGAVVAAAQAHLDDADIGGGAGEGLEGQGRGDLEEADRLARIGGLDHIGQLVQRLVADQGPGDADAFGEAHQVRRGQHMHLQARRLADGAHEGAGRALAVGAGDVDHLAHAPLGMTERGQEPLHPAGGKVDLRRMQGAQALDRPVRGADGIVVDGHGRIRRRNGGFAQASGWRGSSPAPRAPPCGAPPCRSSPSRPGIRPAGSPAAGSRAGFAR